MIMLDKYDMLLDINGMYCGGRGGAIGRRGKGRGEEV